MKKIVTLFLIFISIAILSKDRKPNIVLISLDTFRADRLEFYGNKKNLTPTLNKFCNSSTVYLNVMTPVPVTLPAHATILTGVFPFKNGLIDNGVSKLSLKVKTIAEVLREVGYDTVAFVASDVLKSKYGLSRGFRIYDDQFNSSGRRFGYEITERAITYLSEKKDKPFFLFLHYFDTHQPYLTPDKKFEGEDGNYDDAVSYIDGELKKVFNFIKGDTITIIVSDHGEALGDHGELTHGLLLYQPTVKVLLIVNGVGFEKKVVKGFRTLADIAPTIYEILNIKVDGLDGVSLNKEEKRVLPLFTLLPLNIYRWKPLFGVTDGKYKWIKGEDLKLFDLEKDMEEINNISKMAPQESLYLKEKLLGFEELKNYLSLQSFSSLGYLVGVPTKEVDISDYKDPEKMLDVFKILNGVRVLRQKMNYEEAKKLAFEVLRVDPKNPALLFALGDTLRHLGEFNDALKYLDEALIQSPALVPAYLSKGLTLLTLGRKEEAIKSFEKAYEFDDESIDAINAIVGYYLDINKPEKALPLLEKATATGLANSETYLIQGRVHLIQNKKELAEKDFENALKLSFDPKETLKRIGDIYFLRNMPEKAEYYYHLTIKNYPDYAPAYLTLGSMYISYEKYKEAYEIFLKARNLKLNEEDRKNVEEIIKLFEENLK